MPACTYCHKMIADTSLAYRSGQGGMFCTLICLKTYEQQEYEADMAELKKFPEHEHVWEIVLIADLPVGVTCKVCDHTVQMSDGKPAMPPNTVPVLDVAIGGIYWIRTMTGGEPVQAVVRSAQVTGGYNGMPLISIELETLAYAVAARQYSMQSYPINTTNIKWGT